jgi:hypothetical protein
VVLVREDEKKRMRKQRTRSVQRWSEEGPGPSTSTTTSRLLARAVRLAVYIENCKNFMLFFYIIFSVVIMSSSAYSL